MNETERLLYYIVCELVDKLREHGIPMDGFETSIPINLRKLAEIEQKGERR